MDYIFSKVDFSKLPLFSIDDQKYKFMEVKAMDSTDELGFFFYFEVVRTQIQNDSLMVLCFNLLERKGKLAELAYLCFPITEVFLGHQS